MALETVLALIGGLKAARDLASGFGFGTSGVDAALSIADPAARLFTAFAGISFGNEARSKASRAGASGLEIIRLSDRVCAAPAWREAINLDGGRVVSDVNEMRTLLDPLACSMGSEIFASAISETPNRFRERFAVDPWSVLINPRPLSSASPPLGADYVPILFTEGDRPFVGWQTRGTMQLLGCDFSSADSPTQPTTASRSYFALDPTKLCGLPLMTWEYLAQYKTPVNPYIGMEVTPSISEDLLRHSYRVRFPEIYSGVPLDGVMACIYRKTDGGGRSTLVEIAADRLIFISSRKLVSIKINKIDGRIKRPGFLRPNLIVCGWKVDYAEGIYGSICGSNLGLVEGAVQCERTIRSTMR